MQQSGYIHMHSSLIVFGKHVEPMESVVRGGENGEFVHVTHINGLCANK
jgi:hypothetical protein